MEFFRVYGRVIGLLHAERGLAIMLALTNVAVAALQFYEPVLFGKVVDLLATAKDKTTEMLWSDARHLLGLWAVVGIGGIVANIVVSLQADRMAHRRRLGAMANFFEHVLLLPFSFHSSQHSGRLIKVMLTGVDDLFAIWLSFFRENLATFVALFIMLPLSLLMNWRLGVLLVVLLPSIRSTRGRVAAITGACLFVLAIGLSRLYLGVHWATDVIGGWVIGFAWLYLCLTVRRVWRRRASTPVVDQVSAATDPGAPAP